MYKIFKVISKKLKSNKYFKKTYHILTFFKYNLATWPKKLTADELKHYKRVLVLAPHPDDEVFGMGGTIIQLKKLGCTVQITWLTNSENKVRVNEACQVLDELGITQSIKDSFPSSNSMIYISECSKIINDQINYFKPDLICLPSLFDCHRDHANLINSLSKSLSSNKWSGKVLQYEVWSTLVPNVIVDVSELMEFKQKLMAIYKSQVGDVELSYIDRIIALNRYRGMSNSVEFAEGFCLLTANDFLKMNQ